MCPDGGHMNGTEYHHDSDLHVIGLVTAVEHSERQLSSFPDAHRCTSTGGCNPHIPGLSLNKLDVLDYKQGLWQQHAEIFRDSHDAMRSVMWHKDQKSVCALVLAIVNEAQTL